MKWVLGICTFILGVYLFTASPSIGWVDSGVIATAAKTLGIPNPPGFPAYLLAAHAFLKIPLGTDVGKLKLFSQLSAVGISALTFALIWFLVGPSKRLYGAVVGSLGLAFSYNVWSQANNIETYTFTNLVLMAFLCWLITRENIKPWYLLILGLLGGLALGLNPMIVGLAPAVLLWLYKNKAIFLKNWPFLILGFVACILGFVIIYSYLPLRAATHPFLNWGDPVNWPRIKNHLVGAGLNIYEPETNSINGFTGQPKIFWESFLHFWYLSLFQFTPLLFPLVIWGGYRLYRQNRWVFWMLTSVILANMTWVVLYYGGNQESWMITSFMIMAVFLGFGIASLPARFARPWIMVLGGVPLVFWFGLLNRSNHYFIPEYGQILYRGVPENSVVVGGGDMFNSLTVFLREVEQTRRDIVPITGNMFYIFPWYRENLRRNSNLTISTQIDSLIKFKSVDEFTQSLDQLVADNPDRPFFVTPLLLRDSVVAGTSQGNYHTQKYDLLPHGLLLQIVPKNSEIKVEESLYDFPEVGKPPFYLERNYKNAYRLLRHDYAAAAGYLGEYLIRQGNVPKAREYFQKSVDWGMADSAEFVHRLAIFYAQTGNNDQAKKMFETSIARDPNNQNIKQNYQVFLNQFASDSAKLGPDVKSTSGLKFTLPNNWKTKDTKNETAIWDPTGKFKIQIFTGVTAAQEGVYGQLLEQGPAKIPNTDSASVKVWSNQGISTLEFFLQKGQTTLRLVVAPADSPLMKDFDAIVTSLVW